MDVAHSDFFWAKSRQMATQFSENGIFCPKFLRKKFAKKRQKTGFFGDGVTTFMATGYSFQSFLKYIRQLSRNLPRCSPLWLHQETGKKKHWLHMFLHNGTICSYQVPYFVNAHLFFQQWHGICWKTWATFNDGMTSLKQKVHSGMAGTMH